VSKGFGTVVLGKIESVEGSDASGEDVEMGVPNTELESTDVVIFGIVVVVVVVGTGALIAVAKSVMVTVLVIVVLPPLPYEV